MRQYRLVLLGLAVAAALSVSLAAKTKFSSVWQSPDAATISFAGKKVAALVIDKDDSLRVAGEEALVRELNARGMNGVASYRMMPKELAQDPVQAKTWYEKAGVEGVVAFRVVNDDRRRTYVPATWTSTYYTSLWGYYGYGWGAVYDPGYVRDQRTLTLSDAIRKMSLMPAQRLERASAAAARKGRLQPGADADIAIFDLATVADRATYATPAVPATGFRHVLVNGVAVVRDGKLLEVTPGRAILRER